MRDKLAGELARSAVSNFYDEYAIKSLTPRVKKSQNKTKNKVITETRTHVKYDIVYCKNFVHKKVSNTKADIIEVSRKTEKIQTQIIDIYYKYPFNLNTEFLAPTIKLLYLELPFFSAVWKFFVGVTSDINKFGFPVNIKFDLTGFCKIDISSENYTTNLKNVSPK